MKIINVSITPNIIQYEVQYRTNRENKIVRYVSISYSCTGDIYIRRDVLNVIGCEIKRYIHGRNWFDSYLDKIENR